MSLINCPECQKQISDKAVACPNCGFPLNAQYNSAEPRDSDNHVDVSLVETAKEIAYSFWDDEINSDWIIRFHIAYLGYCVLKENNPEDDVDSGTATVTIRGIFNSSYNLIKGKRIYGIDDIAKYMDELDMNDVGKPKGNFFYSLDKIHRKKFPGYYYKYLDDEGNEIESYTEDLLERKYMYGKVSFPEELIKLGDVVNQIYSIDDVISFPRFTSFGEKKYKNDAPTSISDFVPTRKTKEEYEFEKEMRLLDDARERTRELIKRSDEARNTSIKCPNCGSLQVAPISTGKKMVSTAILGMASKTIGKSYHCAQCNYYW